MGLASIKRGVAPNRCRIPRPSNDGMTRSASARSARSLGCHSSEPLVRTATGTSESAIGPPIFLQLVPDFGENGVQGSSFFGADESPPRASAASAVGLHVRYSILRLEKPQRNCGPGALAALPDAKGTGASKHRPVRTMLRRGEIAPAGGDPHLSPGGTRTMKEEHNPRARRC